MKNRQNLISHEELHKKWMKDPEFRREYEKLEPEFQIARALIDARVKKKMTQAEIAKKANQIITGEGNHRLGLFSEDLY